MESSSDSDDCQLYTRAAENIRLKRKNLQAKLEEFEKVINLVPDEEVESVLKEAHFEDYSENGSKAFGEPIISNILDSEESDDDIPLAVLSRSLRSNKKRNRTRYTQVQRPKKSKRTSRKQGRKSKTRTSTRDLGVIVLDDDIGYPSTSLSPIDFNSRSKRKRTVSNECLSNISLSSILNKDSDEDECYESDSVVTITVEWHNGQRIIRKEFKLRTYQKLETVFEELAKMEGVPASRVLLMHDFNSVRPVDTPSSLNFKFYGALTGSVSTTEINHDRIDTSEQEMKESNYKGVITVKLQLESHKTLLFTIMKHQKMDVLYKKCSEELKCEESKIKITFDGEYVDPNDLLTDLDVEDGELFHVYIKS